MVYRWSKIEDKVIKPPEEILSVLKPEERGEYERLLREVAEIDTMDALYARYDRMRVLYNTSVLNAVFLSREEMRRSEEFDVDKLLKAVARPKL